MSGLHLPSLQTHHEPNGKRAFQVHWPNGKVGLVVCSSPLQVYEILEAESDITQCTVEECKSDFCVMFDTQTGIYTEKKPESCTKPELPSSLASDLYKLKLAGDFCDVVLQVEDKSIPCHKTVLAARSLYFKTIFTTQLQEGHQKEIKLQSLSFSVLDAVIEFMYTSEVALSNSAADRSDHDSEEAIEDDLYLLRDYLTAADYFDIPSLTACVELEISKLYNRFRQQSGLSISYVRALVDLYNTAAELRLRDLQKNIAACFPMDPVLHSMDLPASLQEDIKAAFLIDHNTAFYFGVNHRLYELLETGSLSNRSTIQDITRLEEDGADATQIFAGHNLVSRECNNMCQPDMSESIWQVIKYFLEKRSYPINCLDQHGQSMLHIAAVSRNEELVVRLLQAGADPRVTNKQGFTVVQEVKRSCNSDIAYFICQDLMTIDFEADAAQNPTRVSSMIDQHRALWTKARSIIRLLHSHLTTAQNQHHVESSLTHDRERKHQFYSHCLEALSITLNDDFITKAADKYISGDSTASLNAEGLHFMHISGTFSSQFHTAMMSCLFRNFMSFMESDQFHTSPVEEVKKEIRERLTRDVAELKTRQRDQLCSLRTLYSFGVFSFPRRPSAWWVGESLVLLSNW